MLASTSPRRRELLAAAGLVFDVLAPGIDECPVRGEAPADFACRAASEKAAAVAARLDRAAGRRTVVLGCDTVVVLGCRILGKPRGAAEAARMLRGLSGRAHGVLTGVCLLSGRPGGPWRERVLPVRTEVVFRRLSPADIARYVATGEPMDKAGAYGIQGAAAGMVRTVRGSYTNVVGLPLAEVLGALARRGVRPPVPTRDAPSCPGGRSGS